MLSNKLSWDDHDDRYSIVKRLLHYNVGTAFDYEVVSEGSSDIVYVWLGEQEGFKLDMLLSDYSTEAAFQEALREKLSYLASIAPLGLVDGEMVVYRDVISGLQRRLLASDIVIDDNRILYTLDTDGGPAVQFMAEGNDLDGSNSALADSFAAQWGDATLFDFAGVSRILVRVFLLDTTDSGPFTDYWIDIPTPSNLQFMFDVLLGMQWDGVTTSERRLWVRGVKRAEGKF